MKIKARVKGSPLSPAERQQRVDAARRSKTRRMLDKHYVAKKRRIESYGVRVRDDEALFDDISSELLGGFRNLDEARDYLTGKRGKDFVTSGGLGYDITAEQLQWAIDREQARVDKIKELDRVRVVSPTGRETGLGSMVLNLSTMLKRGKKK